MSRTYARLARRYYWPGMSEFVPDHIQACRKCLDLKPPISHREPTEDASTAGKFEKVSMDILDVTAVSERGNRYILVVADHFSKYTEAYPLSEKSANSVAEILMERWMSKYGFPLTINSDHGERI